MCEISKKSIKHVTSNEKSAQNTYEMEKKKSIHKYLLVMYGYVEVLVFFLLWKTFPGKVVKSNKIYAHHQS